MSSRLFKAAEPTAAGASVQDVARLIEQSLNEVRAEFTVMPRFAFHQPLDYLATTLPPDLGSPVYVEGVPLPLPAPALRMGYSPDDDQGYLNWGRHDHDLIVQRFDAHCKLDRTSMKVLDFGCSSGRVLRHFYDWSTSKKCELYGVDIQALPIEWMREFLPPDFKVFTGTVMPSLPFEDNSFDMIYGFSVFTHIKYLWDTWLLELRRVLKPGGILLQTIHTEKAWRFYHEHQGEDWVRAALPERVWGTPEMDVPYLFHGDIGVSQTFFRTDKAREMWGRYLEVLEIYAPSERYSFQDMVVCRK